ncbi:MAG: fructose-specific PTS transporter subunit EIIC [Clostridia bacterium]
MKITDLINKDAIDLNVHISTKKELIKKAIELMAQNGNIKDLEKYENLVLKREKEGSTGIGEGIAIPHGKGECITKPGLAAMVIPNGADFDALDGNKVNLLFLIAAPDTKDNIHLDVLSRLSTLLMDASFRENLLNAKSKDEFLKIIDNAENAKLNKNENQNNGYELLGITGCPTGIAHTYMAAEGLENAGKEMGHLIKVETQGQSGAQNVLTDEEIKRAKAIIIAADVNVDLSRFNGKKVLRTGVTDGIRRPKELIEKALNDDIPIYHGTGSEGDGNGENANSNKGGKNIYKHLMSGVTHMLPFVVGGGILIAIAFLLDDYSINPANFGMNTPIAAFFKTIGGMAFDFMLLILSGYIAMSIGDRPGLVVGFVGGAIAKAGTTFTSFSNPDEVLVSSGFLGALLAGFIGGYVILLLKKIFSFMPKSLEGIRTILIYPVAGVLLIGIIMLLINPFVSAINTGLNNFLFSLSGVNKIILGAILAGMMSVDLGGPVNKAAYTFGTGMLAEGHYEIMAAVMIGGMIAPLAIALVATFFPKKLPKKERQAGLLNYVMGLSFISEGAIPFASADPLRVLPSCVVGSAVSGAMSMAFNCTLMAPHGGIFVLPLIGNWGWYLVSLVVGSVVSMAIMTALKKNVWE